jgi:hypothetical protein
VDRIDEIRERLSKATQTERWASCCVWNAYEEDGEVAAVGPRHHPRDDDPEDEYGDADPGSPSYQRAEGDQAFIAHSRADLEWAVSEIERLRAELKDADERQREACWEAFCEGRAGEDL